MTTQTLPQDIQSWINNGTTYISNLIPKRFNPHRKVRKLELDILRASRFSDELPLVEFTQCADRYYALQNKYMQMTGHYFRVEEKR